MSGGDDDMAEIDGVDPTPIHHPVDDEAIASAVQDATGDVEDGTMDHEEHHHGADDGSKLDDDKDEKHDSSTSMLPDLSSPPRKNPNRKRARRVGRIAVVRKVARLSEAAAVQGVVSETQHGGEAPPHDGVGETSAGKVAAPPPVPIPVDTLPRVLSKHDEKWNAMFQELLDFKEKHGHTNVPQAYSINMRLGRWVHYQRVEYWVFQDTGGGKITPERISRLEAIGFEWDPQKAQWDKLFKKLKEFEAEMGHCKVPKGYTRDPELANWVRNQRLEHANMAKGKKSRMTPERFKLLDDLGFRWSGVVSKQRNSTAPKMNTASASTATGNAEDSAHPTESTAEETKTDDTGEEPSEKDADNMEAIEI